MNNFRSLLVVTAVFALAACSTSSGTTGSSQATAKPLVTSAGQTTGASDSVIVMAPDGTILATQGGNSPGYRADVEACYSYAAARVDHDERIESDLNAAFDSSTRGLGLTELRGRMNNFERSRRRPVLFNDCMMAKGHTAQ